MIEWITESPFKKGKLPQMLEMTLSSMVTEIHEGKKGREVLRLALIVPRTLLKSFNYSPNDKVLFESTSLTQRHQGE